MRCEQRCQHRNKSCNPFSKRFGEVWSRPRQQMEVAAGQRRGLILMVAVDSLTVCRRAFFVKFRSQPDSTGIGHGIYCTFPWRMFLSYRVRPKYSVQCRSSFNDLAIQAVAWASARAAVSYGFKPVALKGIRSSDRRCQQTLKRGLSICLRLLWIFRSLSSPLCKGDRQVHVLLQRSTSSEATW